MHEISLLRALFGWLLRIIDKFTDPPIMRERINAGSDKYFEEKDSAEDPAVSELFRPFGES